MAIALTQPAIGSTNWGADVNNNWTRIADVVQAKNFLINPRFAIWQRGTSFSATGYTADRWRYSIGSGGSPAATITRQAFTVGQTDVPYEPQYFCQMNQSAQATSSNPQIEQRVEGVRTIAGTQVTLSFYAKVSSGTLTVIPRLTQCFGTGGSPSSSVDTDGSNLTITTSWQKFTATLTLPSISGKTLGSNNDDYLSLVLVFPLSTTFTFSLADIQMEPGAAASSIVLRLQGEELALCQRYYQKTYNVDTNPGTGTSVGMVGIDSNGFPNNDHTMRFTWSYGVEMRATPTVTTYGSAGVSGTCDMVIGYVGSSVDQTGTRALRVSGTNGAASTDRKIQFHATVDAEL